MSKYFYFTRRQKPLDRCSRYYTLNTKGNLITNIIIRINIEPSIKWPKGDPLIQLFRSETEYNLLYCWYNICSHKSDGTTDVISKIYPIVIYPPDK